MAEDAKEYPIPSGPRQSAAPSEAGSLPRLGGPSPRKDEAGLPRLTVRNGRVEITKGGRGSGAGDE